MAYTVIVKPAAERQLKKLDAETQKSILRALEGLRENPHPAGCKKLAGLDLFRVRTGVFRIVYTVERKILTVLVVKIGHRRDVYKGL